MACAECDSQHHAACSNAPHRHKSTAPTTATRNLPARLREAAAAADAADADDADATADATTAAIDDATLASTAKKKQKVGPNAGVVSSGPDGILKDDVSNPLGSNPDEAIAGGGCVAVAFTKHDIFSSKEEAVAALDAQRDEWESWTGPGRLRADQKCDAFLGKRGETWHRQIIQRAVKAAGYIYIIVPATELNSTDSSSSTASPTIATCRARRKRRGNGWSRTSWTNRATILTTTRTTGSTPSPSRGASSAARPPT